MKQIRTMHPIFIVFIATLLAGCSTAPPSHQQPDNDHLIMSVLFVQQAAEYDALCYQAFNTARVSLAQKLMDRDTEKPPAVLVDIDETLLDNSPYEAKMVKDSIFYPTGWDEWIQSEEARPVPGALEFLRYADLQQVKIFYVSNRKASSLQATMTNLNQVGFPQVDENRMYLRTETSGKEARRMQIADTHEIVMLVGDNLNDFSEVFEGKSSEERTDYVVNLKEKFGNVFIMLPNPMYGEWEGALYDYQWSLPPAAKDSLRREMLNAY